MNTTQAYLNCARKVFGSHKPNFATFILEHGRDFSDFAELPPDIRKGRIKQCFENATNLVFRYPSRFTYCEGYANGCIPVLHAWVIDNAGKVIELTWPENGASYYGIPFQTRFLLERLHVTDTYGLLDQPRHPELLLGEIPPTEWLHPKFATVGLPENRRHPSAGCTGMARTETSSVNAQADRCSKYE